MSDIVTTEPIKDDIQQPSMISVRQTYGEAKARYYVMMVGGGVPTRPHGSRFWAEKEAQRLAAQFPDKVFHVLKVKASFEAKTGDIAAVEARLKLKIGQPVRVNHTHYLHPRERGEITGFTPVGAVNVRLVSGIDFVFAPTSLRPLEEFEPGTVEALSGTLEIDEETGKVVAATFDSASGEPVFADDDTINAMNAAAEEGVGG